MSKANGMPDLVKSDGSIQPDTRPGVDQSETQENYDIYRSYRNSYSGHLSTMDEDWAFASGMQWTEEEVEALARAGQAPHIFNHLRRIAEMYTAQMSGKAPKWQVSPRLAASRGVAAILSEILGYVWEESHGGIILQQVITDMIIRGTGCLGVSFDQTADFGRGDIRMRYVSPMTVFWDPSTRDILGRDAEHVVNSQLVAKSRLAQMYPEKAKLIEKCSPDLMDEDYQSHTNSNPLGLMGYADGDRRKEDRQVLRLIDRFTKVMTPHLLVLDPITGESVDLFPKTEEKRAREMVARMDVALRAANPNSPGLDIPVQEVQVTRIRQVTSITSQASSRLVRSSTGQPGGEVLVDQILPISEYPLVPIFNGGTFAGNPFCASEVRDLRGPQEFVNKMFSLLTKSATGTASGGQWMVHEESGATEEVEAKGSMPNAIIKWSGSPELEPKKTPPSPMPQGHFALIEKAEQIMDSVSGMFAQLQGAGGGDRESARIRAIRQEESGRRPDLKLRGIEAALGTLGGVALEMIQSFYVGRKVFSISDTAGRMRDLILDSGANVMEFDGEAIYGSVNIGAYAVQVTPGSTRPTSRQSKLAEALEFKALGLIDTKAVAEMLDDPVLMESAQRMSESANYENTIKQLQDEIRDMSKALNIQENENTNARKAVEVAQFQATLEKKLTTFERRLMQMEKSVGIEAGRAIDAAKKAQQSAVSDVEQEQAAAPTPEADIPPAIQRPVPEGEKYVRPKAR